LSAERVLRELRGLSDPSRIEGMKRFGINTRRTLGLSVPTLREMARRTGKDHELALALWDSGVHEARLLAAMVDDPTKVSESQMDSWVEGIDSWDVCDLSCGTLFDRTPFAHRKALEWAAREEEFVKRAGFAMMATLAVHDKAAPDQSFTAFFPSILRGAEDERNFVKKAVNWALRQIGKRNRKLNREAIALAKKIGNLDSKSARWVASDAMRELSGGAVQKRLSGSS
jgi:3-methyladenine DNA glycosylase AlkD